MEHETTPWNNRATRIGLMWRFYRVVPIRPGSAGRSSPTPYASISSEARVHSRVRVLSAPTTADTLYGPVCTAIDNDS